MNSFKDPVEKVFSSFVSHDCDLEMFTKECGEDSIFLFSEPHSDDPILLIEDIPQSFLQAQKNKQTFECRLIVALDLIPKSTAWFEFISIFFIKFNKF